MPITIKTQKSASRDLFDGEKFIIHGLPGTGKSTFVSSIPGAVFLDFEHGLNHLPNINRIASDADTIVDFDARGNQIKINNPKDGKIYGWGHLKKTVSELSKSEKLEGVRVVALDTLDIAFQYCAEYARHRAAIENEGKNKFEHESDLGFGKAYELVRREFMTVMNRLFALPYGIILIAHSTAKTINIPYVGEQERIDLDLRPAIAKELSAKVSSIFYLEIGEKGRVVRTNQSRHYNAKCRISGFPDEFSIENASAYEVIQSILDGAIPFDNPDIFDEKKEGSFGDVLQKAIDDSEKAKKETVKIPPKKEDFEPEKEPENSSNSEPETKEELPGEGVKEFEESADLAIAKAKDDKKLSKLYSETIEKLRAAHKLSDQRMDKIFNRSKLTAKKRYSIDDKKAIIDDKKAIIDAIEEYLFDAMLPESATQDKVKILTVREIIKRYNIAYQDAVPKMLEDHNCDKSGEKFFAKPLKELKEIMDSMKPVEMFTGEGN